jgi:hypothetical protein
VTTVKISVVLVPYGEEIVKNRSRPVAYLGNE